MGLQAATGEFLQGFFDNEMHRQHPIAGAVDAMNTLAEHAYRLSQAFSKFYAACPIMGAPDAATVRITPRRPR